MYENKSEIRRPERGNPKSEGPKSEGNPKARNPKRERCGARCCFRISDFGFLSDFGFRISDFFRPFHAMSVIVILILASLSLALAFLAGFVWAVGSGQYEDTFTPSMRVLAEEEGQSQELNESNTLNK